MTFEQFARITDSTFYNTPTISSFERVESDLKKLQHGDLYITDNPSTIPEALIKGVYGILTPQPTTILDPEIAWFAHPNLHTVIQKLMRFWLKSYNTNAIYLEPVSYEILQTISCDERLLFLGDDYFNNYKKILQNVNDTTLIFSSNLSLLRHIHHEPSLRFTPTAEPILLAKTLFTMRLIYQEFYYDSLHLSPLFLSQLKSVLTLVEKYQININLLSLKPLRHFHPIFVSNQLKLKHFGDSERVLICETEQNLLEEELLFLKKEAPWAKILQIGNLQSKEFDRLKEIKMEDFNFILINANYNELLEYLKTISQVRNPSLFSE